MWLPLVPSKCSCSQNGFSEVRNILVYIFCLSLWRNFIFWLCPRVSILHYQLFAFLNRFRFVTCFQRRGKRNFTQMVLDPSVFHKWCFLFSVQYLSCCCPAFSWPWGPKRHLRPSARMSESRKSFPCWKSQWGAHCCTISVLGFSFRKVSFE